MSELGLLVLAASGTALATGLGAIPVFALGRRADALRPLLWGLAAGVMTGAIRKLLAHECQRAREFFSLEPLATFVAEPVLPPPAEEPPPDKIGEEFQQLLLELLGHLLDVLRRPPGDVDPQPQAHRAQHFLDLVQALAPEVRRPQHLRLGLLHQVADGDDGVVLRAVGAARRVT